MDHAVVQNVKISILQIINKLNGWTNGKQPILDKVIKICGWSSIAFIVTQIARRIWYTAYHKYKKYPPGPIGVPFFGVFFNFLSPDGIEESFTSMGQSYGPITMYPLGKNYEAMINDMHLANNLFKLAEFSLRPADNHSFMGDDYGFAFINGKEWNHRRKLFYNSVLRIADSEYMTKYVQSNIKDKIIVPSIEEAIKNNDGRWDPKEACFHYAFSTIFGASFGPNLIMSPHDKKYKEYQELTQYFFSKLILFLVLPIFSSTALKIFLNGQKPYIQRQEQIMVEWIKNKSDSTHDEKSYIDMMMEANIKQEVAIKDINMTFRVGTHTTAGSTQLMIYTLAKYPKVQQKVYMELREIFGESDDINIVDPKVLNKAHFLRALIEETFRLKCIGGGLQRALAEDFRVDFVDKNGKKDYYILPKGCSIVFNLTHMTRTADYGWKNGNEWNIRNYLDENDHFVRSKEKFDDRFKLSIFGMGRRICPGISLARRELMFALAILVYKYEFCGPKGKGDTDFVISKELPFMDPDSLTITVIKR